MATLTHSNAMKVTFIADMLPGAHFPEHQAG